MTKARENKMHVLWTEPIETWSKMSLCDLFFEMVLTRTNLVSMTLVLFQLVFLGMSFLSNVLETPSRSEFYFNSSIIYGVSMCNCRNTLKLFFPLVGGIFIFLICLLLIWGVWVYVKVKCSKKDLKQIYTLCFIIHAPLVQNSVSLSCYNWFSNAAPHFKDLT